jgi:hypothetical protein
MKAGRIAWSIVGVLSLCAAARAGTPPTAKIMVNPVPAKVGPPYPPLIGGGPNIVGNELRLDAGGVRVWVEVQFKDWDPNGDGSPGAKNFFVTLDGGGLLDADTNGDGSVTNDGDQENIVLARVPCDSYLDCGAAFGESFLARCGFHEVGICDAVYTDKGAVYRLDGWCAERGCGCCPNADIMGSGWDVFGDYNGPFRPDDATVRWGATAVYDVPPGAKGKYTVRLNADETFLQDGAQPPREIPSLSETGFIINVLTGRCCFALGTPQEGCTDGVLRSECGDDEPAPVVFTPETHCPPEGPDCERVTGACCDGDPFDPCKDDTILSDCQCPTCTWHGRETCEEVDCPRNNPIPTASGWGLAVLTLLLTIGAKIAFGRRGDAAFS